MVSAFIFQTIRMKTEQLSLNGTKVIKQILHGRLSIVHMKLDGIKSLVIVQVNVFTTMVVHGLTEKHALHGMHKTQIII